MNKLYSCFEETGFGWQPASMKIRASNGCLALSAQKRLRLQITLVGIEGGFEFQHPFQRYQGFALAAQLRRRAGALEMRIG
jgi:hypothetical protein